MLEIVTDKNNLLRMKKRKTNSMPKYTEKFQRRQSG